MPPFTQGFLLAAGLIIAIGAQNAFVLTRAVRRNHHVPVAVICILCDALLISAGLAGVGGLVAAAPFLTRAMAWAGAVFLLWYGWSALRSALRGGGLETGEDGLLSLRAAILTTLAVTLLNPHVYIDTVMLLGGLGGRFPGGQRLVFGAGAVLASFVWFIALCLFGRILAPLFRKPLSWRILDGSVCLVMWFIAGSLVMQALAA